jgi:hypothetical protein
MKPSTFLDDVIQHYKRNNKVESKGFIHTTFVRSIYELSHPGTTVKQVLEERLARHGYTQKRHVSGCWKHVTRAISFTLIIDELRVKYVKKEDAQHLSHVLK